MICDTYFGALRTAVGATTFGAHDVSVCGLDAVRDRKLIVPGAVGSSGGRAHLISWIIGVVENDGHPYYICPAAGEVSGDRDVVPDQRSRGGSGGGDGRGSFYPHYSTLCTSSLPGAVRAAPVLSAPTFAPQSPIERAGPSEVEMPRCRFFSSSPGNLVSPLIVQKTVLPAVYTQKVV